MSVKASPEVIREMEQDLLKTASDLEWISSGIQSVLKKSPEWDDEQSQQFMMLMRRIGPADCSADGGPSHSCAKAGKTGSGVR